MSLSRADLSDGEYEWQWIALNEACASLSDGRPSEEAGEFEVCSEPRFVRGDPNSDGTINLTDGIVILNFLFLGQAPPACMDAADIDDDGGPRPSLTDAIRVFNWLFTGGPPPAAPAPSAAAYVPADCGPDTTDDGMDCLTTAVKCEGG